MTIDTMTAFLTIMITIAIVTFGFGVWFYKINMRMDKIEKNQTPLVVLHKKEILTWYLENGILPNPGMTPRKKYLLDKIQDNTVSYDELQELSRMLDIEQKEAEQKNDTNTLLAILALIALVYALSKMAKK